jgi:very-short-patch-repair endonuclease
LGEILEQIFPGIIGYQDHLDFLGRQRADFSVRKLSLAFEYDGPQHFEARTGTKTIQNATKTR